MTVELTESGFQQLKFDRAILDCIVTSDVGRLFVTHRLLHLPPGIQRRWAPPREEGYAIVRNALRSFRHSAYLCEGSGQAPRGRSPNSFYTASDFFFFLFHQRCCVFLTPPLCRRAAFFPKGVCGVFFGPFSVRKIDISISAVLAPEIRLNYCSLAHPLE